MIRLLISLAALLATLAEAAPVAAQDVTTRIPVSYADLNLAAPAGRIRLQQRIEAAVRQVCGGVYDADFVEMALQRDCRLRAREGVRHRVDEVIAEASRPTQFAAR